MNKKSLSICIFLIFLAVSCAQQSIVSKTPEQVVINAMDNDFVEAYLSADEICQKDAKSARYISEGDKINILIFECFAEAETVTVDTDQTESTEIISEDDVMEQTQE